MAQPQPYSRTADFAQRDGDDTDHNAINQEFDGAALTIGQLRACLALIQRDDGALQNGIVTGESLAPAATEALQGAVEAFVTLAQQASESALTSASVANLAMDNAGASAALAVSAQGASAANALVSVNAAGAATTAKNAATLSAGQAANSAAQALLNAQTGPSMVALAAPDGAALVGNGLETVAQSFEALQLSDYAALRAYTGPRKSVFATGYLVSAAPSGIAGLFVRDDSDTTSADNGGTIIVRADAKRYKRVFSGAANIKWFGAKGDGTTNDTLAFAAAFVACKRVEIPGNSAEVYKISKYPNTPNLEVIGLGRPTINLFFNDTAVMVQFGSNSYHEGIKFQSTEANLNLSRATFENATAAYVKRCGFYGFRQAVALPNAWGVYFKNSIDCTLDHCDFGNNSQSDIAVVDNNRNLTIIEPQNSTDAGVYLNVEPNATDGVIGLNVIGGKFRKVTLLENSFTAYASTGIKFSASVIASLLYDGSGAAFDSACVIGAIANDGTTTSFAGNLDISLGLSKNLIDDPYLIDLALSNAAGQWTAAAVGVAWAVDRVRDASGTYLRLNKNNVNQQHIIKSGKITLLTGTNPLLFMQIGRQQIPAGAGQIGNRTLITYFTAGDVVLGTSNIPTSRGAANTSTPMQPHFAVVIPPATTAYVRINLGGVNSTSTICDHVAAVGLWEISSTAAAVNTRALASAMVQLPSIITSADQIPNTANHAGAFAGDTVVKLTPVIGAPTGWKCTASGSPGTWEKSGILGSAQSATQTDSVAATVPAVVADLNALMAKLRAAKLMA